MKTIEQLKEEIKATPKNDLVRKVLINNLNAVVYNDDVINDVVTAFNKYAGKKIGERTLEKINADLQKTYPEMHVYFHRNYNGERDYITIFSYAGEPYFSYSNDTITIQNKDYTCKLFNENSEFNALDNDNLMIINRNNYIADPAAYLKEKSDQFKAIQDAIKKYDDLCKKFRENGIVDLESMPYVWLPHSMMK